MTFDLAFQPQALRSKLGGSTNRHKIKLHAAGFRLIDELRDQQVLVLVMAVLNYPGGSAQNEQGA